MGESKVQEAVLVQANGVMGWRFPSGRFIPMVAGGDGTPPREGEQKPSGEGDKGQEPEKPESYSADYVKKLRDEAAAARVKLKELEEEIKKRDNEKLSEAEKLQKAAKEAEAKAEDAERRYREAMLQNAVLLACLKPEIAIVDPDAAYRLLDRSGLEFDKDGNPLNLDDVLKKLKEKRPWLAGGQQGGSAPSSGGTANPNRSNSKGTLTIEDIGKMSAEEINRRWDEVQATLKAAK